MAQPTMPPPAAQPMYATAAPPPGGAPMKKKASGASVTALVMGIVTICIAWIPFVNFLSLITLILAIVFGVMGIRAVNANPTMVGGKGLAIAGLVLGLLGLAFWILVITVLAAFFSEIMKEAQKSNLLPQLWLWVRLHAG